MQRRRTRVEVDSFTAEVERGVPLAIVDEHARRDGGEGPLHLRIGREEAAATLRKPRAAKQRLGVLILDLESD